MRALRLAPDPAGAVQVLVPIPGYSPAAQISGPSPTCLAGQRSSSVSLLECI
jgi:hypothetical protein